MPSPNPFRYFKTSPEIIRLAVMLYVRFPLSLRNVEDLLHERGIDVSHETVRFWWNRFGPMFAAEIRGRRVDHLRAFSNWRWHVDEQCQRNPACAEGRRPYPAAMPNPNPFRYFKTSPEVIRLAVMLYVRFPLSLRNVEDLLHERGIDVSHETVRFWWNRFGPMFAAEIRRRRIDQLRAFSTWRWHVDELFVKINGERHYLWRAVDHEGEVLEAVVTKRRNRKAALKFLRKAMRRYGRPEDIVTDQLASYHAALKDLGANHLQKTRRWLNNRAENSHLPLRRRERAMLRFRCMRSLQKFAAVHSSVFNHFNQERSLSSRDIFKQSRTAALAEWRQFGTA